MEGRALKLPAANSQMPDYWWIIQEALAPQWQLHLYPTPVKGKTWKLASH